MSCSKRVISLLGLLSQPVFAILVLERSGSHGSSMRSLVSDMSDKVEDEYSAASILDDLLQFEGSARSLEGNKKLSDYGFPSAPKAEVVEEPVYDTTKLFELVDKVLLQNPAKKFKATFDSEPQVTLDLWKKMTENGRFYRYFSEPVTKFLETSEETLAELPVAKQRQIKAPGKFYKDLEAKIFKYLPSQLQKKVKLDALKKQKAALGARFEQGSPRSRSPSPRVKSPRGPSSVLPSQKTIPVVSTPRKAAATNTKKVAVTAKRPRTTTPSDKVCRKRFAAETPVVVGREQGIWTGEGDMKQVGKYSCKVLLTTNSRGQPLRKEKITWVASDNRSVKEQKTAPVSSLKLNLGAAAQTPRKSSSVSTTSRASTKTARSRIPAVKTTPMTPRTKAVEKVALKQRIAAAKKPMNGGSRVANPVNTPRSQRGSQTQRGVRTRVAPATASTPRKLTTPRRAATKRAIRLPGGMKSEWTALASEKAPVNFTLGSVRKSGHFTGEFKVNNLNKLQWEVLMPNGKTAWVLELKLSAPRQ